ncbi:unnamed protein product [Pleuronectes platessa]|uniref:Uncharacterized protein n=1 Tax=Pleuronectes platessa TaxID=8262 RepID=A0A9N7VFS7_PLEPL|nr:unnamed protein product [Pleuronectes platessa]
MFRESGPGAPQCVNIFGISCLSGFSSFPFAHRPEQRLLNSTGAALRNLSVTSHMQLHTSGSNRLAWVHWSVLLNSGIWCHAEGRGASAAPLSGCIHQSATVDLATPREFLEKDDKLRPRMNFELHSSKTPCACEQVAVYLVGGGVHEPVNETNPPRPSTKANYVRKNVMKSNVTHGSDWHRDVAGVRSEQQHVGTAAYNGTYG